MDESSQWYNYKLEIEFLPPTPENGKAEEPAVLSPFFMNIKRIPISGSFSPISDKAKALLSSAGPSGLVREKDAVDVVKDKEALLMEANIQSLMVFGFTPEVCRLALRRCHGIF